MKTFASLVLSLIAGGAQAGDSDAAGFKFSGSGELWAYATGQSVAQGSTLNPGNRIAHLPARQVASEARFDLRLTGDAADGVLRPIVIAQRAQATGGNTQGTDTYLSQGYIRIKFNSQLTATAGRELLTWGPANFRSPSHPLYLDAGRTNPLREVPGIDLARLTLTTASTSTTFAHIFGRSRLHGIPALPLDLAKLDWRGNAGMISALIANPVGGAPFFGAFAQTTPDDAWLIYGEFGSGRRPAALQPAADGHGPPFTLATTSPRRSTFLLGASYTLEQGQTVSAEWLRDGHGFNRQEERRYFARAGEAAAVVRRDGAINTAAGRSLGMALSQAPALLGQNYLALLWQSNPQDSALYWRGMWTANLGDHSQQASFYGEKSLNQAVSVFVLATRNAGSRHSEFASLLGGSLTVGVKFFAF